jgi:hypothetical protein
MAAPDNGNVLLSQYYIPMFQISTSSKFAAEFYDGVTGAYCAVRRRGQGSVLFMDGLGFG